MKINNFPIVYSKLFLLMFAIGVAGFHWQCAAVSPPSGGPKDETPPTLVSATPESGTTHFGGEPIELVFSEYLFEESIEKAITVFPRLPEPVTVKFKGEELLIAWPDSLDEDQTYILTIGRALMDEHKVKLAETIQLAYSTGEELAKGEISGEIYSDDETIAHLWKINAGETADSVLFREPDYITESTEEGLYKFQYLSPGNYQICSVGLENSGRILIPNRMKYGLSWESELHLQKDGVLSGLNMIPVLEAQPLRITKGEWITPTWGKLYFSEPISANELNLDINFTHNDSILDIDPIIFSDPQDPQVLIIQTDSIRVENRFELAISSQIQDGNFVIDSTALTIRIPSEPDTSYLSLEDPKRSLKIIPTLGNLPVLELIFSEPVILRTSIDSILSFSREDSTETAFQIIQENPMVFSIELLEPWVENKTYLLTVDSVGIIGINGRGLKTAKENRKINTTKQQGYGGLLGTVISDSISNPVIKIREVEKPENFFISDVNSTSGYRFETIPNGQYMFMLYDDMDGDKDHTSGLAKPYQPSEWFMVLKDTVEIRANWDIELDPITPEGK